MRGLSDISIRNPVLAWMLMAALMIFGAISFSRLGVSQLPDVDFPVVSVNLTLEGAAPEVMEVTVVDPIENALMTVEGVKSLSSSSKQGNANVSVEFELGKDIDVAVQEIQTKITQVQRLLPRDLEPPTISKSNPDDQPILWLAVTTTNPDRRYLMTYVRDFLKDQFTTVSGVGDVFLGGYVDPNLRVWVQPEPLLRYNMSVNDVIDSIRTEHSELPGGQIQTETKNYNVRTLGEAKSVEEFGDIIISNRVGAKAKNPFNIVRLNQVAKIEEGLAEVTRVSRFNKQLALGVGIRKQKGSNAVAVARAVKAKMIAIQDQLPKDIKVSVNFDTTKFIEESIHELNFNLILSALLTALACWMFLGSWSATLNVVLAIPTSILGAFIPLYFMGFTLNTFTLLGLSLAIGIVVDDAIMVLENIFRHREEGRGRIEAAIIGAREIYFAALAATLAIVVIFLPVAFMKGVIGKFFMQFGVTISFAVIISLIEALTITPMRCAQFVSIGKRTTRFGRGVDALLNRCQEFYTYSLKACLNHPWKVLTAALGVLVVSFFSVRFLNKEFAPAQDQSAFLIRMQTPPGSSLNYTDSKVKMAEDILLNHPAVKQVYVAIGGFGGGPGESNTAVMFLTMKPKGERKISQQDFMGVVRTELSKIPDLRPTIQDLSMRGFSSSRGFPIEFTVRGRDWEKLYEVTKQVMDEMQKNSKMTDIDSNYLLGAPEIQITPNRASAAVRGVSVSSIGQTINSLIGGVVVGQYQTGGHRYDIRVQITKDQSQVENIKNLLVGNQWGNLMPLSQVVTQEIKPSLQSISRIDRQRAISVYANLTPGASQQAALDDVRAIADRLLPEGYSLAITGSSQAMKESFQSLFFALILGLIVAYMVLASNFNSFIDPISVLLALPFSISGAFLALLISGQSLNIYSMIGLILLMGIVKKNSIILVDYTNTVRDSGISSSYEALVKACPIRLRPILMTSFVTIAAAIPPALALGAGAENLRPMATAIIGGVLVSTLLTLYVVPVAYMLLSRFQSREKSQMALREAFERANSPRTGAWHTADAE